MHYNYSPGLIHHRLMALVLLFLVCFAGMAQDKVLFESGPFVPEANMDEFSFSRNVSPTELIHGNYYRYLQFAEIPTQEVQQKFKQHGMEVMAYLPHKAYLMSIPQSIGKNELRQLGVKAIWSPMVEQKADPKLFDLPYPDFTMEGSKLKVSLLYYEDIPQNFVIEQLSAKEIEVVMETPYASIMEVLVSPTELTKLALLPFVKYIERMPPPAEKEDTGGRSLQRSNQINVDYQGGLKFDATGVNMLVRDDGEVGPHVDYKGRLLNLVVDPTGTHGDGVAGVMGGAGNIDPDIEGGASGAFIYVTQYFSNFLDSETINAIANDSVVITNSSYSNGCNAGYTSIAQTVDQQIINTPVLMHVFSGGNSNNNNCGYGAGSQWGNVTGGHKVGKNVMTVANLFADEDLVNSSSRGPAHDGRIKPDISAHGQGQLSTDPNNAYSPFGGTSAAAPSMAGNMGQLYQAYKTMHGGVNPPSALIKAAIMNTAHDLGNKGPDFR